MKKFSKMRRLAILMAAAMQAAAIGLAGTAWAAKVAVFNFSFETPAFGVGGFSREFAPGEGWTTVQTGGGLPTNNRFDSGVFRPDIQSVPGELPEGNQVGYSNGPRICQVLVATVLANTIYTLTVAVGARSEPAIKFPGFKIELKSGTEELVSATGIAGSIENGEFKDVTVMWDSTASNVVPGAPLEICLHSVDVDALTQVLFDNIRLDAEPTFGDLTIAKAKIEVEADEPGDSEIEIKGTIDLGRVFNPAADVVVVTIASDPAGTNFGPVTISTDTFVCNTRGVCKAKVKQSDGAKLKVRLPYDGVGAFEVKVENIAANVSATPVTLDLTLMVGDATGLDSVMLVAKKLEFKLPKTPHSGH